MWMYVVRLPEWSSKVLIAAALRKVPRRGAGVRPPTRWWGAPNEGGA